MGTGYFGTVLSMMQFAANTAALVPRKEVLAIMPGTSNRPADIYPPMRGLPTALDVTVISTLQKKTVLGASSSQGFALRVRRGKWWLMQRPAVWSGAFSFLWWWRLLVGGVRSRFTPLRALAGCRDNDWDIPCPDH